jgi:hypothetical protein
VHACIYLRACMHVCPSHFRLPAHLQCRHYHPSCLAHLEGRVKKPEDTTGKDPEASRSVSKHLEVVIIHD